MEVNFSGSIIQKIDKKIPNNFSVEKKRDVEIENRERERERDRGEEREASTHSQKAI